MKILIWFKGITFIMQEVYLLMFLIKDSCPCDTKMGYHPICWDKTVPLSSQYPDQSEHLETSLSQVSGWGRKVAHHIP